MIFVLGPIFLACIWCMSAAQYQQSNSYAVFALIIFGSLLWGYFHLIRQHWGFVALYQKKNQEKNTFQYGLDATLLFIGSTWPFLFYLDREFLSLPMLIAVLESLQQDQFIPILLLLACMNFLAGFVFIF